MRSKTGRFRRADRVLASRDFKQVLASGTRVALESFVVTIAHDCRDACAAGQSGPRLGITVSKRVGGAVIRNQVKRRVREWFRHSRSTLPPEADVIVIARHSAREMSARETAKALDAATRDSRVGVDGRAAVRAR